MTKKVLLIAGGGTLGSNTSKELLNMGCDVDVICLEDYKSDNEHLNYINATVNLEYLTDFLKDKHYDGIVNFIHYKNVEDYKPVHMLLTSKTDRLVFLSSYRVYADLQHPITESAPQLYDISDDKEFLETEDYAVPKSKCEHFIREESNTSNWTIVRPVISFSFRRFDIVTENYKVVDRIRAGETIVLPLRAKNLTASLDWAGNSGKLIARLIFAQDAAGEAYTVSSAQNLTWGEVADMYTELVGAKFDWQEDDEYFKTHPETYILKYDRLFDRIIDNSKILKATGLTKDDFTPIKEGLKIELENLKNQ